MALARSWTRATEVRGERRVLYEEFLQTDRSLLIRRIIIWKVSHPYQCTTLATHGLSLELNQGHRGDSRVLYALATALKQGISNYGVITQMVISQACKWWFVLPPYACWNQCHIPCANIQMESKRIYLSQSANHQLVDAGSSDSAKMSTHSNWN